jgi:ATP synthase protein I
MENGPRQYFKLLAVVSSMGISMVVATFMGLALGYVLDHYVFGTEPWLTIIFLVLGIIAGFRNLYIIAKRVERILSEDSK